MTSHLNKSTNKYRKWPVDWSFLSTII